MTALVVDDLRFDVQRSERRRTMRLTVDRGGELLLAVPAGCSTSEMERFVREKRLWIYTRLAEKDALYRPLPKKEFVNGEGFPYLGRHYRLLLVREQRESVALVDGRLRLVRSEAANGARRLRQWYIERASQWLPARVAPLAQRVGREPRRVVVRDLGFRWGSCGASERVNFHWKTMMLPPRIVDYVIVHELAHLFEPNHTPKFWARVERTMPDFATRRDWLREHAAALVGGLPSGDEVR